MRGARRDPADSPKPRRATLPDYSAATAVVSQWLLARMRATSSSKPMPASSPSRGSRLVSRSPG
jgi:hypothetical protein